MVRVDYIIRKPERLRLAVKGDRLVSGQSNCSRPVFSVGSCIGERIQVYGFDMPFLICPQTHMHLHLMSRGRCDHGFLSGKYDLGRFSCLPCHNCRINLRHCRLLRTEPSADPGFDHSDLMLRDIQGISQDPAHMERHLSRRYHIQSSIGVHICKCTECLHHSLLIRLCVIDAVNYMIAGCKHCFHIPVSAYVVGAEISLIIRTYLTETPPVLLRMYQDRIVLCRMEIQHRLQYLVFDLHQLHGLLHSLFRCAGYNRRRITHEPYSLIQDQAVIRACLRIGLSCKCKSFVWTVLVRQYTFDPRNRLCF